jgi:hypothetical protein
MAYNATGDLTGITHVTSGMVATLTPVGNGVSQFTDIRASTGNGVARLKRLRPTLDLFVSRANAFFPLVIALPAFGSAAVGEFATICAGIAGAGLGIIVANEAKDAQCSGNEDDECDSRQRCERAKSDANRISNELKFKRIPHYLSGGTKGSDENHYITITQKQANLKDALRRVRLYCNPLPPEIIEWDFIANQYIPILF